MRCRVRLLHAFVPCIVLSLHAGCRSADRLSYEGFGDVQQAISTQADVRNTLGPPDHQLPDLWIYQRPEQHLYVKIEFDDEGRVTRKEWIDGTSGRWDDTENPAAAEP